ncbi:YhcN/YlaJ family sporulation lipoprotein [Cytobacillus depressus]|uniref:YhcN/YlaJ family sporulation lipoprotein n=1 Tax=Cytobacillus depressus TaxID=1602942 RepID=A0A6L3V030_9BACI|nr:YhcN/YlaJ family sporulation lipoprotein [Cytobacillus depressus]KAB2330234.1 YhcN/YlaJ family sporulation lipoprotein [Cytobacillus depressus]
MKAKALLAGILTTAVLTGCGVTNKGVNDTAFRNRNVTEPTRVNNPITNDNRFNTDRNFTNTDLTPVRNNTGFNNNSRMRVADEVADRIVALPEVDKANVIVTNDNAYVSARLVNNTNGLSRDVERKIADQVKAADPNINDVYCSVNPGFYNQMTNYSNNIRNGRPVEGFYNDFTTSVRQVFPDHFNR